MDHKIQTYQMLDLMRQAAFSVENGIITHVNAAAACYLLQPGTEIESMLITGQEEYRAFTADCLYLTLDVNGFSLGATVVRTNDTHIFVLEEARDHSQLQTLALAAMELRQPLAGAMLLTDRLSATDAPCSAQLNQRMMQLQRIVTNMSDCAGFAQANPSAMEYVEICGFWEELLAKAALVLSHAGLRLTYTLPAQRVYTIAHPQKLERAVYNLLSNAAKFSPQGGAIHAQLVRNGNRLAFSVTDQGQEIPSGSNIFTRYLRQPGLEDPRFGLGLGMVIIRSAAAIHGGAVLIDHPEGTGNRVTMTIAIQQSKSTDVHSPAFRIDYAGERDHCLLELADVLPAELYQTNLT